MIGFRKMLARQETARLWGEAFTKEASSRRFRLSQYIWFAGFIVALAYTFTLTWLGPNRAADWLRLTAPLAALPKLVLPSIGRISADLVKRGDTDRADFVANIIAIQWLATGLGSLLGTALLIPEKNRLRRAFVAARDRTSGSFYPRTYINLLLPFVLALTTLIYWPPAGYFIGQDDFDPALDNRGLYFPLAGLSGLWACLYWIACQVIALFGKLAASDAVAKD